MDNHYGEEIRKYLCGLSTKLVMTCSTATGSPFVTCRRTCQSAFPSSSVYSMAYPVWASAENRISNPPGFIDTCAARADEVPNGVGSKPFGIPSWSESIRRLKRKARFTRMLRVGEIGT